MLTLAGSLLMVPAWFTATTTAHYGVNSSIRQAPQTQDPWLTGNAAHRYPPAFTARLSNDATSWPAVLNGARQAADLQLAIRRPVLPLGGFNGYDPAPTLRSFQTQVAAGHVHYYIPATGRGANPAPDPWWDPGRHGPSQAQAIDSWVRHTYRPTRVDGVEVYDLTHAPNR